MNGTKVWWKSKAVWGAILVAATAAVQALQGQLPPGFHIPASVYTFLAIAGSIYTGLGRLTATERLVIKEEKAA